MIEKIVEMWTAFYKQRRNNTNQQEKERKAFLEEMFWAVSPSKKKILEKSTDERKVQDRLTENCSLR